MPDNLNGQPPHGEMASGEPTPAPLVEGTAGQPVPAMSAVTRGLGATRGSPAPAAAPAERFDALPSITRLLVGLTVIGVDELVGHLPLWEQQAEGATAAPQGTVDAAGAAPADPQSPAGLAPLPTADAPRPAAPPAAEGAFRHALIGWIFTTEQRLLRGGGWLPTLQAASHLMMGTAVTIVRQALLPPRRAASSPDQGQLAQWIARGQVEEEHSRRLARVALDAIVDGVLGYVATKPEVRDLVRSQGTGFVRDVATGVRDRSADADSFVEGVARSLFRRPPRPPAAELPAPAERPPTPRPVADTGGVP